MLKGIDPLLSPELLRALRAMGHGDEIVIVDANYPAASAGPPWFGWPASAPPRLPTRSCPSCRSTVSCPRRPGAWRWSASPTREQPIFDEFRAAIRRYEGEAFGLAKLERFAFYARAAKAFAIVATGERRLYGNLIMKKGVVRSD